jgi:hypothetical protein
MNATVDRTYPEDIHLALWRASQLARGGGKFLDTAYASLSAELPGGGWPAGSPIELSPHRTGIGELRLFQPALALLGKSPIGLIDPPNPLNGPGLDSIGLRLDAVVQLRASKIAQALGSRAGSKGGKLRGVAALGSTGPASIAKTLAPGGSVVRDVVCRGSSGVGRNAGIAGDNTHWPATDQGTLGNQHSEAAWPGGRGAIKIGTAPGFHTLAPPTHRTSGSGCDRRAGRGGLD